MGQVDAGVEQGDRHAVSVETGQIRSRAACARSRQRLGAADAARKGGGERGAHRVHGVDLCVVLDQHERARVERGGEAVQHARIGVVALDGDSVQLRAT